MGTQSQLVRGRRPAAPKGYAYELGWRGHEEDEDTVYRGQYRARGLRYEGWIVETKAGKLTFYILNPPLDLLRETDFGGCFHYNNGEWWLIGFKPFDRPADAASGIAAIQKSLLVAFEARSAKRRAQ